MSLRDKDFLENYEKTYLKKIEDIPHNSRQLFISLYNFLSTTQEKFIGYKFINLSLYLYDILIDILYNPQSYLNTYLYVSKAFKPIKNELLSLLEDKDILIKLKEILKAKHIADNSMNKKYSIFFDILNSIWDYLFDLEEEKIFEERQSVKKSVINRMCEPRRLLLKKLIKFFEI